MKAFKQLLNRLDKLFMGFAALTLFVMMCSISFDAFARYFFNSPIQGQFEFTRLYSMVILGFMAMPRTYMLGGHIQLRLLEKQLNRIPGSPVHRIHALLVAAAFGAMSYVTAGETWHAFAANEELFGIIQFPMGWSYLWVPLGCGLMACRMLIELIDPPEARFNPMDEATL